jgi:hypothetical protein
MAYNLEGCRACRIGNTVLLGSFGSVNLTSTGTGSAYIVGVNNTVTVDLTGEWGGLYIQCSASCHRHGPAEDAHYLCKLFVKSAQVWQGTFSGPCWPYNGNHGLKFAPLHIVM